VLRFLVASVGRTDADDCFQETYLAALKAYPRLRDESNLSGWVMTIAHRKALDLHRKRGRDAVASDGLPDLAAHPTDPDPGLWADVRALPDKQRYAIALRYAADMTYADIAAAMDSTPEAVRQNVREGLKNLRKRVSA
jgi:RNA polymerase sigma factor (sigma-70 family)